MTSIHICFSCDNSFAAHCGVAIASILTHAADGDLFSFYILDDGISVANRRKFERLKTIRPFEIRFIPIQSGDFKDCPIRQGDHVSRATYYRFKIPGFFPELNKILYLDCDLLATANLRALFEEDLGDDAVGMVADIHSEREKERLGIKGVAAYGNGGVMLLNLRKWRDDALERQLFDYVANNPDTVKFWDQDAVNIVLRGKIRELDSAWNLQFQEGGPTSMAMTCADIQSARIIHYSGRIKPWSQQACHSIHRQYYTYLKLTPWHQWWKVCKVRGVVNLRICRRWLRNHGV